MLKHAEQSREIAKHQTLKAQNAEKMALIKAEEAFRSKLESEKVLEKALKEQKSLKYNLKKHWFSDNFSGFPKFQKKRKNMQYF